MGPSGMSVMGIKYSRQRVGHGLGIFMKRGRPLDVIGCNKSF